MPVSPNVETFREVGVSGLKHHSGYVSEEFLTQLQGDKAVKVFQEMGDNDPTVGTVLYALENVVRQVTWTEEGPNAALVRECRENMSHSWEDLIAEILSKLQFGWAYHEIVYTERDGKIVWRKIPIRAQSTLNRWELDPHGGIQGMWQNTGMAQVFLPISKSLHFRTSARKNNPQGKSVLRTAYRPWWFKKRIEEFEGVGVERDLAGIPKIGVPAELLQAAPGTQEAAALAIFKDIGENLRNDDQACVIYPLAYTEQGNELYKIELMGNPGRREFTTGPIIERKSLEIAMSALADVILIGHESVGSFALSSSKERLLLIGLQSQVDEIASVFNRHALPRLFALNGIDDQGQTKLVPGELQATDLAVLAEIIWKLSMAGMAFFPSDPTEARLRALLDLPAMEGTELERNANLGAVVPRGTVIDPSAEKPSATPVPEA